MPQYYIKYQKFNKKTKEKIKCTKLDQINYIKIYNLDNDMIDYYKKML